MSYGEIFYSECNDNTTQTNITIVVQLLQASFVGTPDGSTSHVVVTVRGPIKNAYIGHQAGSGDAYDFAATPVAILFGGSGTLSAADDVLTQSDVAAFAWDGSSNILIAFEQTGTVTFPLNASVAASNAYYKFTTGDTATVNKSGYSTLTSRTYSIEAVRLDGFSVGAPVRNKILVCDGNSLMVGWNGSAAVPEASPPGQLVSLLRYGTTQTNFGVPGATTAQRKTADQTAGAFVAGAIAVIWEGTNDIFFNDDAAAAVTRYYAWLDQVKAEGYKVIAGTILPRNDSPPADFETARQAFNTSVRAGYAAHADALADIGADATIGAAGAYSNSTYYYGDAVHLRYAGEAIVAGLFKTAILGLASRGLFQSASLAGLGAGGSGYFRDPLSAPMHKDYV